VAVRYLVTGGLGYLGQHIVAQLIKDNHEVVVFDIKRKSSSFLQPQISCVQGDLSNPHEFQKLVAFLPFDGVFHVAAVKSVEESIKNPFLYFKVNCEGTENLATFCVDNKISRVVYTSSAAVYGDTEETESLDEKCTLMPTNPYGKSKLMGEEVFGSFVKAKEFSAIALRCFNIVGAKIPSILNKSDSNILPILVRRILSQEIFEVFGNTYGTKDGSCIRDYINVQDVAIAHIFAMDRLANRSDQFFEKLNISSGYGTSIFELIKMVETASGMKIVQKVGTKRTGDPAQVIGNFSLAKTLLKWEPHIHLRQSVVETFQAFKH